MPDKTVEKHGFGNDLFSPRPKLSPSIYAYELIDVSTHQGLLKVDYTERDTETRVAEQLKTSGVKYRVIFSVSAMYSDGGNFRDHDIHRALEKRKIKREHGEWFRCSLQDLQVAYIARFGTKRKMSKTAAGVLPCG